MRAQLRPALVIFILLSITTGVFYPLAITGFAQVFFPVQANGSIIDRNGAPVGSTLIGQEFCGGESQQSARFFWGRPSATSPVPYTAFNADKASGSSGSNLGPTNPALLDNVKVRVEAIRAADATVGLERSASQTIPIDLVTSSASGLDPHISIAAAEYQVPRVAKARGMTDAQIRELVHAHTQARSLGLLGEPTVNVLELNLALDAAQP